MAFDGYADSHQIIDGIVTIGRAARGDPDTAREATAGELDIAGGAAAGVLDTTGETAVGVLDKNKKSAETAVQSFF